MQHPEQTCKLFLEKKLQMAKQQMAKQQIANP
jgi:hypothetical protein